MTERAAAANESGNRLPWVTWLFLVIGCSLGAFLLFGSGDVLVYVAFVAWPVSMVGLVLGMIVAYRHWHDTSRSNQVRRGVLVGVTTIAAGVFAVGHTLLAGLVLGAAREHAKTAVTASNLKGLGGGARVHCDEHGFYPPSLQSLVEPGRCIPMQLVSIGDPRIADVCRDENTLGYSSFDYCPGVGAWRDEPEVILAHERQAWSALEVRVFPRYGRCTLFGNGRALLLGADEFAAAKRRDKARRAELGWPVCE